METNTQKPHEARSDPPLIPPNVERIFPEIYISSILPPIQHHSGSLLNSPSIRTYVDKEFAKSTVYEKNYPDKILSATTISTIKSSGDDDIKSEENSELIEPLKPFESTKNVIATTKESYEDELKIIQEVEYYQQIKLL